MNAPSMTPQSREWTAWLPLVVIVVGVVIYLNSFAGVFLFDDKRAFVHNPNLHALWPLSRVLGGWLRRPLTDLTFALNYVIGGPRVVGYHAVNLAIHLSAALVLFGLVRRTLDGARLHAHDRSSSFLPNRPVEP